MPEPRNSVLRMRPYCPPTGGRHDQIRLDFNENTVGCSPRVREVLVEALNNSSLLAAYPDYSYANVHQDLAPFFGVADSEMVLTNGTDEAIQLLINTFVEPGQQAIVMAPTYAMYRFYAEVAGAEVVEVPFSESRIGTNPRVLAFDVEKLLRAVTPATKAIFLANPNNPTGSVLSQREIVSVLEAAPHSCVMIDEAYFEFFGSTVLPMLPLYPNLFVSRTFSKAHGLAGLRIGALLTQAENAQILRKAQSPYSVNALAALAARAAAEDRGYVERYVRDALEGKRVIEKSLPFPYWESHANFVLFDAGDAADEVLRRSADSGVLIRDRRHEIPGALRVTAGTPEQARRFLEAIK